MDEDEILLVLYRALVEDRRGYGVVADSEGYVDIDLLSDSIYRKDCMLLDKACLLRIIQETDHSFYEISHNRIRVRK